MQQSGDAAAESCNQHGLPVQLKAVHLHKEGNHSQPGTLQPEHGRTPHERFHTVAE